MPDVQHAATGEQHLARWRRAVVATKGTHHEIDGTPMYAARFECVLNFHEPGLAPARDASGAFHIGPDGSPTYARRFHHSWGFYDGLACVVDKTGWFHIRPDGSDLYSARLAWCGNFQERRCTVRGEDRRYYHITADGRPAYASRHLYAGDFREGAAVVRFSEDGLCGHVDVTGRTIHGERFQDLDTFHKGFARARDRSGWMHVDRSGSPVYSARFASVEPFYNGQALVETMSGTRAVIGVDGMVAVEIGRPDSSARGGP